MESVDYIFFDLDGVLVDSRKAIANSINYALRRVGIRNIPKHELYPFIGMPLNQIFKKILPAGKKNLVKRCIDLYRQRYSKKCVDETKLFQGVRQVLKKLAASKLVVVSTKPEHFSRKILDGLGISGMFTMVVGPGLSSKGTSKSSLIRKALKAVNSRSVVMVGDTRYDIAGARLNKIPSIAVTYGIGTKKELARADYVINDLRQLAGILRVVQ